MGGVHQGARRDQGAPAAEVVLDTDVFSYLHRGLSRGERFQPLVPAGYALAFPTVAELFFGAEKARWGPGRLRRLEVALTEGTVLLADEDLLRTCGRLRAEAFRRGHPLAHQANANDLWIAACAAHHRLPLVTGNTRHFEGLPGLTVLTPEVAH